MSTRGRKPKEWAARAGARAPEIDVTLPGLALLTGRTDRLRTSSKTRDAQVYERRVGLVRALWSAGQHEEIVRGLALGMVDMERVDRAHRRGDVGLLELARQLRAQPIAALIDSFRQSREIASIDKYCMHVEAFAVWVQRTKRVPTTTAHLVPSVLAEFLEAVGQRRARSGRAVTPATRNRYRASLSAFSTWCLQRGHLSQHPLREGRLPAVRERRARVPVVTPEEVRGYIAALHAIAATVPEWAPRCLVLEAACQSGADVSEIIALGPNDLMPPPAGSDVARIVYRRGKTAAWTRERQVPVSRGLLDRLASRVVAGRVFPELTNKELWTVHQRARRAIGRPELTIKGLRHVSARLWRWAGADIGQIQQWLGHATVAQTMVYADIGPLEEFDAAPARAVAQLLRGEASIESLADRRQSQR